MTAAATPPFSITAGILSLVEQIGEAIGRAEAAVPGLDFRLRREARVRTVHGSVAIEGNALSEEQVSAILDGNGRLGRLWQTLILTRWKPLFSHVPFESVVRARQSDYYEAIERSSGAGDSTFFIRFMLEAILDAVREGSPQETPHVSPQVNRLLRVLDGEMSRREVLEALGLRDRKWLRQAYLGPALKDGLIEMARPETPSARNQRYRLTPAGRRRRGRTP
ncbi:MAG: hypothetical protein F4Y77_09380 [Holophagales bacterium]|nr:hypothetical protein [Holophagales bacterium]